MTLQELLDFIDLEDSRLKKRYGYTDTEKRILGRTVKLNEEIGELCSAILANSGFQRKDKLDYHKRDNLIEEFADVIITTLLIAKVLDVDIEYAISKKISKINKRY